MDKIEEIISLLEKESLTRQEEDHLQQASRADKDIKKLIDTFYALKSGLKTSVHIDDDLLMSYLLLNKGNEPESRIVLPLKDKISDHLKNCPSCSDSYKFMESEYSETAEYLSNTIKDRPVQDSNNPSLIFRRFGAFKYAFASIAAIFILYLGLFSVSSITTPEYKKNLFAEQDNEFYKTRGRTSIEFQKALDALEHNDFLDAANYLQQDINDHSNESSIFYSYYILGLSYLKSAESNFLGMFNNFDANKVRIAIDNLNKSIEKNTSGNYENLNLDAHYYLGRSYLLIGEKENAKQHLSIVIDQKGKFYNEALSAIEENK